MLVTGPAPSVVGAMAVTVLFVDLDLHLAALDDIGLEFGNAHSDTRGGSFIDRGLVICLEYGLL